jgi:hypothetical protein
MIKFIRSLKPVRYIRWWLNGGFRFDGKNGREVDLAALRKKFNLT